VKNLKQFQIASTRLEPGVTLIEASAGTGKTFTIAGIVLRLVLELRIPIEQILAVTYTVAATEELRDRVRKRLHSALGDLRLRTSDDDVVTKFLGRCSSIEQGVRDLDLAVQNFDEARIFTIHGFCQRVLHDYAFESGMLFDTELLTDPTSIFEGVAQDFWRKQFYEGSAFLSWLAIARDRSLNNWIGLLQQTLNHPDLIILPGPELEPAAEIGKQVEKKFQKVAAEWSASGAAVSRMLREDSSLSRDRNSILGGDKINQIEAGLAALSADFRRATSTSLDAINQVSRSQIERSTKRTGTPPRHRFFDLCEDFCNLTRRYFHQLDHDFMAFVRREIPLHKARLNVLTYDDLLTRLRDALKSEAGETLVKALGAQYRAALIDEFQDTDPVQYDIFRRVFASGQLYLFLIGDPKQAIYGFRGADVFTYLRAAGEASLGYTLNVNYRSEKRLLEAVNTLFGNAERPFLIEGIEYRPVSPAKKSREGFFELVERTSDGPLRFRFLRSDGKKFNQTDAESHLNRAIAADIARLRASGPQLGGRALRFGDMAVLVRSNAQAANLQNVLRASGIKSVLKAEDSVFKAHEARETLRLLEAVLEPGRDILLRTALTTRLIGLNAAEILAFDSAEDQWQGWLEKFLDYRSRWENACFIALFRYVFVDQKVRERLVRYPGGERVLTNFLHIAELLHRAETEQRLSPDALCAWLREHIGDSVNTSDEDQLRLESDDDAVLLATVHKSKGLEYPVVFCPFLWKAGDAKNRSKILFHDPANDNRLTLDLRTVRPDPDNNDYRAGEECMAESLRALYVALTRAQNRCYVYTGEISGFDDSPLAHVLGKASSLPGLEALAKGSGGSIAVTVIDPAEDPKAKVHPSQTELVENLSARHFSGSIRRAQMIASFTGLTSGRAEEEPDRDAVELPEQVADTGEGQNGLGQNGLAGFQGGIRAGVFLHDVLEHLDFQAPDQIEQLVRLKLATHGIAGNDWREAFCAQLRILLETPLEPGLTLSQISLAERLSEVEFSYPIASLRPDQLQELFVKHGSPELPSEFPESLGRLYLQTEGFMRGFIDLLFRFGKRYYIIDWKSNWLGNRPGDYDGAAVRACMLQHSYYLQYHLYTVAADLYLSSRICGYEYDKQFGGVFYVFFRGLDAGNPNRAIFRDRPRASLVRALRQLLIHGLS
jgi:exodeoxyribonuclease V beta subunit